MKDEKELLLVQNAKRLLQKIVHQELDNLEEVKIYINIQFYKAG